MTHLQGLRALALSCLLAAGGLAAQAATVAGHDYAEQAQVAGKPLVLNGVGVRQVAWFQGYTAALYAPQRSTAAAPLLADTPRRLRIRMLVEVSSEEFVKAFDGGIDKRATEEVKTRLATRMARFDAQVRSLGTLKKGDAVDLDFIPGRGLVLSLNGQVRGEPVEGADLYAAMLDIFIGDRPVDAKLKAGLLGGKGA